MSPGRCSDDVGESHSLPSVVASETETLDATVAGLAALDADQLRLQWRNHLGGTAPAHLPRWLLLRVLAYRLQAAALGDLDKATARSFALRKAERSISPAVLSRTAGRGRGTELASTRERCSSASGKANWKG